MPRRKSKSFTDVELEFMRILWKLEEATPDDIAGELERNGRSISPGSIRNVLAIMMRKGYISRRKEGRGFRYRAKVRKDQARKSMLRDLLENVFEGSEALVVAALLDGKSADDAEIDEIRRLLDDTAEEES